MIKPHKLPIGIQDFKKLIEGDYVYIDKTKYIHQIINSGSVFFLSRPRRFGKSLTISTMKYLFEGEKDLFKNTYIYNHWDFDIKYPVIHLSMSELDTKNTDLFHQSLIFRLNNYYDKFKLDKIKIDSTKVLLQDLVYKLSKINKVVVLIDEYDKPLLDHLFDKDLTEFREYLRNFYGVLKDLDPYLKFVFLTGISKFSKIGIFSTLNNLNDISNDNKYSQFLGYTEEEIKLHFNQYLDKIFQDKNITKKQLLEDIKDWYDGYSFNGLSFVYNPFSLLNFFSKGEFNNFWFESGSPSFLVNYVKNKGISINDIKDISVPKNFTSISEIEVTSIQSFLYQAGYLTISSQDEIGYFLNFPNKEVRTAFSQLMLIANYSLDDIKQNNIIREMIKGLKENNFDLVIKALNIAFANIPSNLFTNKESFYHSVILSIFYTAGFNVIAEESTSLGNSDLVLEYNKSIYVIELKTTSINKAISQIKDKKYYQKYLIKHKPLYAVGMLIDLKKRNIAKVGIVSVKA